MGVRNQEKSIGVIDFALFGEGIRFYSRIVVYIPLQNDGFVTVGLSDNATTFIRNLQRNFDLLRNVTGLTLTFLPKQSSSILRFQVNASQVRYFASIANDTKLQNAGLWVSRIIQGMLTLRTNGNGSKLYVRAGLANLPFKAVPLEKQKVLIGAYIGTLIPAFFIVADTVCTVLAHIVVCIFLMSPPGDAWDLLEAHRRHHGDRILAAPPGDVVNIQEIGGNREEHLEKNQIFVNSQGSCHNLRQRDRASDVALAHQCRVEDVCCVLDHEPVVDGRFVLACS